MTSRDTLRHDVLRTIALWRGDGRGTEVRRAEWRALASAHGSLSRDGHPAHFTASVLPLTADGSRVCLVLHRRIGLWVQPGGHLDEGDPSVVSAAAREMREETGLRGVIGPRPLELSRHPAPCRPGAFHLDLQMLGVCLPGEPQQSPETRDVAWFRTDHLPDELASGVAELVEAGRRRLSRSGYPAPPSPGR